MRTAIVAVFLAVIATAGFAQAPKPSAEKVVAMKKIGDLMAGRWKGTGWWEYRPGARSSFVSEETVIRRAGGMALEVRGVHTQERDGRPEVIHDAFGMLWYDDTAKQFRLKSALQNGLVSEFALEFLDDGYAWSHPLPGGGTMRYRATLTANAWVERGEMSAAGGDWRPAFEMRLARVD